jgi:hypothetical protein
MERVQHPEYKKRLAVRKKRIKQRQEAKKPTIKKEKTKKRKIKRDKDGFEIPQKLYTDDIFNKEATEVEIYDMKQYIKKTWADGDKLAKRYMELLEKYPLFKKRLYRLFHFVVILYADEDRIKEVYKKEFVDGCR